MQSKNQRAQAAIPEHHQLRIIMSDAFLFCPHLHVFHTHLPLALPARPPTPTWRTCTAQTTP